MMRTTAITTIGSFIVLTLGCAQSRVVEAWKPSPLVHWEDLTVGAVVSVRDGFRILPGRTRKGVFPASLAVTRVSIERTGDPDRPLIPRLTSDPRNEFLQWNSALDDQFAVGEVFPVTHRDLGGGDANPKQILAAFAALHAQLGLVYAVNELSETETEMLGVLYDAGTRTSLAVLHAYRTSVVPPKVVEKSKQRIDLWETDSRALVRAQFEDVLHGCIYELIQRDQPATVVTPVGWIPVAPVRPVVWPPHKTRVKP